MEMRTVPGTPAPTPIPTYTPSPVTDEADGTFSIVWISDTQHYSELYPDMLLRMTEWAAANREAYNIQAVVHTGDMINRRESTRQWENISAAFDRLGDIPLLALAGNHDVGTSTLDYSYFKQYVASRYADTSDFFAGGRGAYVEIPLDYVSFLLIGTGWGYNDESVAWLNEVIARYPFHIVILCGHSYLDTNGSLTDGGDILFENVVKKNYNIRMVLCGHRDDTAFRTDTFDNNFDGVPERSVYSMLYNYQEVKENGGGGYMRILTVNPKKRTVQVQTYSPYFDDWKQGENEQFAISNLF